MNNTWSFSITSILISLCLTLSGYNNISAVSIQEKDRGTTILEKVMFIEKFDYYEEDNDLFFEAELKNNTNEPIKISTNIKPFSIVNEGRSLIARPTIHLMGYEGLWFKILKPNESYIFLFKVNKLYSMKLGVHDYSLTYHKPFYNTENYHNQADNQVNKFSFTWYREEGSDKGVLISSDFKP